MYHPISVRQSLQQTNQIQQPRNKNIEKNRSLEFKQNLKSRWPFKISILSRINLQLNYLVNSHINSEIHFRGKIINIAKEDSNRHIRDDQLICSHHKRSRLNLARIRRITEQNLDYPFFTSSSISWAMMNPCEKSMVIVPKRQHYSKNLCAKLQSTRFHCRLRKIGDA